MLRKSHLQEMNTAAGGKRSAQGSQSMMRFSSDDQSRCLKDDLLPRIRGIIPNALMAASSNEWCLQGQLAII
jgi:hypothetical protein